MKFTVSANKLEGVIFIFILALCIPAFYMVVFIAPTDGAGDMPLAMTFVILMVIFLIWFIKFCIVYILKQFYNHIDVDGEMMTIYEKFTEPLTINCHDFDKIVYSYGTGSCLSFYYDKHYIKGKYHPVYTNGDMNFDKLLLYLKKNNVELTRGW
jgi:hypothetical protein